MNGDIYREFKSVVTAYEWLIDFTAGQYLGLESDFDFREIVY